MDRSQLEWAQATRYNIFFSASFGADGIALAPAPAP